MNQKDREKINDSLDIWERSIAAYQRDGKWTHAGIVENWAAGLGMVLARLGEEGLAARANGLSLGHVLDAVKRQAEREVLE